MPFLHNAWYCAGWDEDVGRTPISRTLLGRPVMLFRRTDGEIAALEDRCAHRFAPLHKGELEGDVISCPYHGLAYDATGACVRNPHGDGQIPPGAQVRAFPAIERQRAIWLWMGDREKADAAAIPDLELVNDDSTPMLTGHMQMPVDYRLVLDNLLDLTHTPYIHKGTFSSGGKTRDVRFEGSGDYVKAIYVDRNVDTPASQKSFFDHAKGDYHTTIDWVAPGVLHNAIMMTTVGGDPTAESVMKSGHIITPATETSTHYFWYSTRNRKVGDPAIDERLRAVINRAFTAEDEPMIAACQANMGGQGDIYAMKPVSLPSDAAALRVRRSLQRMIKAEQQSSDA